MKLPGSNFQAKVDGDGAAPSSFTPRPSTGFEAYQQTELISNDVSFDSFPVSAIPLQHHTVNQADNENPVVGELQEIPVDPDPSRGR